MFRIIVMEILILWGCYAGYMAVLVHKRGSIGGDWLMMVGNPAYHGMPPLRSRPWSTNTLVRRLPMVR